MKRYCCSIFLFFLFASSGWGQPQQRISFVYPAGGERGTTFDVLIGGRQVQRATRVLVSGKGVSARILQRTSSLRLNEATERGVIRDYFIDQVKRVYPDLEVPAFKNLARQKGKDTGQEPPALETVMKRRLWLDELGKEGDPDAVKTFLQRFYYEYFVPRPDRFLPDPIGGYLRVEITIAPDAPLGFREICLVSPGGISVSGSFHITPCREVCEIEPNESGIQDLLSADGSRKSPDQKDPRLAQKNGQNWGVVRLPVQKLPILFNGQIRAGDFDRFFFEARKGEKLALIVWGRFLSPYLADAVPGWFSPVIAVYDDTGKKLQTADHWRFDPDPIMLFKVPRDGTYMLEVQDALYRGREDFVYRIAVGAFPFITSGSSLGIVKEGDPIMLKGWNLPGKKITPRFSRTSNEKGTGRISKDLSAYTVDQWNGHWLPVPLRFPISDLPVLCEKDLADREEKTRKIDLPVVIEGKIDRPYERDHYSFTGQKGDQIVVDADSVSLGSDMDPFIRLYDPKGKLIASNDDRADEKGPNIGLETHHADPCLLAVLPKDGEYTVEIVDLLNRGGDAAAYRMRISKPRPDFTVYGSPASMAFRGDRMIVDFTAVRKDGFDGEIRITAPKGSSFRPESAVIPAGKDQITCTLYSSGLFEDPETFSLSAVGKAEGRSIVRPVIPADNMEQAFIYHHLVPRKSFQIYKKFRGPFYCSLKDSDPVEISLGQSVQISYKLDDHFPFFGLSNENNVWKQETKQGMKKGKIDFVIHDSPFLSVERWEAKEGILLLTLKAAPPDDPEYKVPEKGNIIVDIMMSTANVKKNGKGKGAGPGTMYLRSYLPAAPYTIHP
ncbi:MAG: PPC domain-containing protein [Planctomycetia bacterium]|nr:PPC domain-containing protein [Planctomycetia bacterium]